MISVRALARVATALGCLSSTPAEAAPASAPFDPGAAIAVAEQAMGRTIGSYQLVDSNGLRLSLRDYRGKPLVVSLIYTACSSVCPPTTQHLIDAVTEAGRVFGPHRFAVLTVGFDARNDTVARMAQFASIQGIKLVASSR